MELKGNLIVKLRPGASKTTRNGLVVVNMSDFTAKILINESAIEAVSRNPAIEGNTDESTI